MWLYVHICFHKMQECSVLGTINSSPLSPLTCWISQSCSPHESQQTLSRWTENDKEMPSTFCRVLCFINVISRNVFLQELVYDMFVCLTGTSMWTMRQHELCWGRAASQPPTRWVHSSLTVGLLKFNHHQFYLLLFIIIIQLLQSSSVPVLRYVCNNSKKYYEIYTY